jgi:hypothetical protein
MYKPPSTLTSVDTPSPAANSTAAAAAKAKKKGRSQSPDTTAPKTHTPTASAAHSKLKGRLSKGKFESTPSSLKKADAAHTHADDSEAELELTRHSSASKRVRLDDADDLDLSPPPLLPRDGSARVRMPAHFTQPTFIRGGRVSVSPEASAKRPVTFGIRDFNRPAFHHADALSGDRHDGPQPAMAAKHSAPAKRSDIMSSSPISAGVAKFESEPGAPLTYVPFPCAARSLGRLHSMRINPFADAQMNQDDDDDDDDDDDEEEDDDENDFHQAMLDADFDFFDSQKTDGNATNNLWNVSQRAATEDAAAAEADDTPATTPRSPQSGCDLPSPGSPRCKSEDEAQPLRADDKSMAFNAVRDSVFVHALPTTQVGADKACQHAGSLTLSLPYTPGVAVSSPQLRARELESDGAAGARGMGDASNLTQTGTPVLQRRKHAALGDGAHALAPLKLGAELMERSSSHSATYMQLSPMIEMDSPLLSPGLTLGMHAMHAMHAKGTELPSPFIMGVDSLPELEHPAALDLAAAEGSTTPKTFHPEVVDDVLAATAVSTAASQPVEAPPSAPKPEPKVAPAKVEKPAARRPALPPPRQIRFTTLDTPSNEATPATLPRVPTQQQQQQQQQQASTLQQHATSDGANKACAKVQDATPELVHSGSSSPDSASDSPSPASQAGSSGSGEAEVETLLFGPPEKLELHELDSAWNGSKAAALRRAHVHHLEASRT